MKKFILTSVLFFISALSVYAVDDKKLAEVIAVDYNSTILEVEYNALKVNDSIVIEPAGDLEGIVTVAEGNIVTLSINNNGFAEGSRILIKNSKKFGKLRAKKAVVKTLKLNSIVLDVENNNFQVQDRLSLTTDGRRQAVVKSVDGNVVTLSLKDSGYAEGSKVFIKKGREKFEGKRKE